MATASSKVSDRDLGPSIFTAPVCLIDSDSDGKLVANEKAVRQLETIQKTVNCVAIAGTYRTGKSYLLNRLAGKSSGFPLGSTIVSKTKGIWVWCIPHPEHDDQVLVLLDTEGLGDVRKGDQNHDNWIFALAVLLSSTLVYNVVGVIDEGNIEKLNFVTEISKHIKTKENSSESKGFDYYFPNFVLCLRDFTLDLCIDGRDITAEEYLEYSLEYNKGSDENTLKYNEPRKCIRRYFKSRMCFTFQCPGKPKILRKLEDLSDSDLDEDFVAMAGEFCRYIYRESPPKKLDIGTPFTGRMFATLVSSYVDAIWKGGIPCIDNALNTMAQVENTKAVDEGVRLYQEFITNNLSLPTDSDDELSQVHHKAFKKSLAFFLEKTFYDIDQHYQCKLNDKIVKKNIEWKKRNEQASVDKCKEVLEELDTGIAKKLKDGVYMCIGGYAMFQHDLQCLQEKYQSTGGLGTKAADTFLVFSNKKLTEGKTILKAEEQLAAEKKKLEDQRQQAMESERLKEAAERETALTEQHIERLKEAAKREAKLKEQEIKRLKLEESERLKQAVLEESKRQKQAAWEENKRQEQAAFDERKRQEQAAQRETALREKEFEIQRLAAEREAALKLQHAEDIVRMKDENIEQMRKKQEEDWQHLKEHYTDVIRNESEERLRAFKKGFANEARELQEHIDANTQALKEEQSLLSKAGDVLWSVATAPVVVPFKVGQFIEQRQRAQEAEREKQAAEREATLRRQHYQGLRRSFRLNNCFVATEFGLIFDKRY